MSLNNDTDKTKAMPVTPHEVPMKDEEDPRTGLLKGENVVVKIGSVVAFLTIFGWAIWWASGVQSDLNSIKLTLANFNRLDSIGARVAVLEQYGTPKSADLEKRLNTLEKEFDLHKATTSKGTP